MKKTFLTIAIITSISSLSNNYLSVINRDHSTYDYDSFVDEVVYTEWIDVSPEVCENNLETNDVYYGFDFKQIETCSTDQERKKQVHRTSSKGTEIISEETEYRTIEEETEKDLVGTHLESDCNNILINDYSIGDGMYHIDPYNNNNPINSYCDMTTEGGGWTAVWKNYGGIGASGINTPSLLSNNNTGTVVPYKFNNATFSSVKNKELYDYYKNRTNVDILKTVRTYDNSTTKELFITLDHNLPSHADIILDLGTNVSFSEVVNSVDGSILNNPVKMTLNGADYGQTDRMLYHATSLGFANQQHSEDRLGQPNSNLMKDWSARHIIYYTRSDGRDAVRCQFKCWAGSEHYKIETVWFYK